MSLAPNIGDVANPQDSISSTFHNEQKKTISKHVHSSFAFFSAAWLLTLAIPLLFFPRILSLIFGSLLTASGELAAVNAGQQLAGGAAGVNPGVVGGVVNNAGPEIIRQLNVLERSLAGVAGLALSTLAAMLIVQTGSIPLTSSLATSPTATLNADMDSQFRLPTLIISTVFFTAFSYYSYDLGMYLLTAGNGALAIFGSWAILFSTASRVNTSSHKVSSYPFKNQHAEAVKKDL